MPGPPLLVLASASPRRRDLLERLGVPFEVRPVDADERPLHGEDPEDLVRRLAADKAQAALAAAGADQRVVVLAADTEVVLDGAVLGKPADAADAARMLRRLSGRSHQVLTGVAVAARGDASVGMPGDGDGGAVVALGPAATLAVEVEVTEVTMVPLTDEDVAWYVATGEPLDKAGAYGIQGRAAVFVSAIRGSHDNVVGLPLARSRRMLASAGLDPLRPALD